MGGEEYTRSKQCDNLSRNYVNDAAVVKTIIDATTSESLSLLKKVEEMGSRVQRLTSTLDTRELELVALEKEKEERRLEDLLKMKEKSEKLIQKELEKEAKKSRVERSGKSLWKKASSVKGE